ncbi:UNVERIFIED_CONTAM: Signal peptidase complex catalytic subunit SEC11A [Sesamum latifolium]|uniref:Signal peptidase complex catalytic subunit SEC11 n=1 Tax=Sesamum latifolium TaxID=2727402 RepID=A0AAW2XDB9_9LAMI
MGWIGEQIDSIKSLNFRQVLTQAVSLGMIVTSALIIWKGLMCITGSESPVVVVLSGSMEPGFKRGDILFLHMSKDPIRAGEIVVFNVDGREIPIVHRVIKVHERQDTGEVDVLTKGDNNFLVMTDFCMLTVSYGYKDIISWEELLVVVSSYVLE